MSPITSPTFVGRQRELALLREAVTGARGDRTTWLIGGEAGVGKTRLVQELTHGVGRSDVVVATGGCIPTAHGSLPFVAIIEALRGLCRQFELDAVSATVQTHREVGLLLPDLTDRSPDQIRVDAADGARLRLFDAVSGFISSLSEVRRVCIVLEDLHWADRSTRDLFVFLIQSLSGSAATLIGTYRSDEMSRTHPFRPLLVELDRNRHVEHIRLKPFDTDEMTSFATTILNRVPTARVLDELVDRSGGNAFFATEILDALTAGRHTVRPELADLILARIESLPGPTQELLRLVSVSGESVRDELLEVVAELSESELVNGLREAIENRAIVLTDDGLLRFRHALMQEAVYGTLLPRERQRAHARYAHALVHAPHLSATKESCDAELAWHFREARDFERALGASVAAARSSMAVLAFSEALGHVEAVLELWDETEAATVLAGMDHGETLRWAAELAATVGDYPRAAQFQRAAIAEPDNLTETERAQLYLRLGRFLQSAGQASESLAQYEQALAAVPPEPPSAERALVLAGYGQQLMLTLRSGEAIPVLEEAIAIARATGARLTEGNALNSLGSILLHNGRQDQGVAMLLDSLEIAKQLDAPSDVLRVYVNLVGGLTEAGNLLEAERFGVSGVALAAELGHGRGYGFFIAANLSETLSEMAKWEESRAVDDGLKRPEGSLPQAWLFHQTVDRALRQGDRDAARRVLAEVGADLLSVIDPQIVPAYWARTADLAMEEGDLDGCRAAIDQGLAVAEVLSHVLTLRAKAIELDTRIAAGSADRSDALARAQVQLEEIERLVEVSLDPHDTKSFRIRGRLVQARAETAQARGDESADLWREAAELWGQGPFVWHRARALFRLGSALLQRGDRSAAAAALVECCEIAAQIGALPLEQDSRRLMEQAGVQHDAESTEAAGTLTPRELAVLRLVAEGRTNRQVGEELFISPKTVSVHVSRVFQKLHVENRTEAAAAARAAGLI